MKAFKSLDWCINRNVLMCQLLMHKNERSNMAEKDNF